jgi:hypothetical protein
MALSIGKAPLGAIKRLEAHERAPAVEGART